MPDIQPLPSELTNGHGEPQRGNPRFGFGTTMALPAYFLTVTLIWWGLGVLLQLAEHPKRVDAVYMVLRAVSAFVFVFGGVMTALMARRQRRDGGRDAVRMMHAAVRSGDLPLGADRATWEPALDWRERQLRRGRWLLPVVFAAFALLGIWLAVIDPEFFLGGLATAALFVALAIYQEVLVARQLPNVRRLKQQLDARRV